jgi:Flp pilus assembly protein TadB
MNELMMTLGSLAGMLAAAGVSFGITFWRTMKSKKNVQTEADVAKADAAAAEAKLAIIAEIKKYIKRNEGELKDLHEFLKTRKGTAGGLKYELVLNAVKVFCLANQYTYDDAELEQMIADEVEFTKSVNVPPTPVK